MAVKSEGDVLGEVSGLFGAYALDGLEVFKGAEGTMGVAVADNAGGKGRADARKALKLAWTGDVNVDAIARRQRAASGNGG